LRLAIILLTRSLGGKNKEVTRLVLLKVKEVQFIKKKDTKILKKKGF